MAPASFVICFSPLGVPAVILTYQISPPRTNAFRKNISKREREREREQDTDIGGKGQAESQRGDIEADIAQRQRKTHYHCVTVWAPHSVR